MRSRNHRSSGLLPQSVLAHPHQGRVSNRLSLLYQGLSHPPPHLCLLSPNLLALPCQQRLLQRQTRRPLRRAEVQHSGGKERQQDWARRAPDHRAGLWLILYFRCFFPVEMAPSSQSHSVIGWGHPKRGASSKVKGSRRQLPADPSSPAGSFAGRGPPVCGPLLPFDSCGTDATCPGSVALGG